jgi:hypothetical protein
MGKNQMFLGRFPWLLMIAFRCDSIPSPISVENAGHGRRTAPDIGTETRGRSPDR